VEAINSDQTPTRWLGSTNDLDNTKDVDRVKACLGMLADDLKLTAEVGNPNFGSARRKRDVIRLQLKCLSLFESNPKLFLANLVDDMFNHGRPGVTIRDLTDEVNFRRGKESPSDLDRLVMRLAQAVNDKRNLNMLAPAFQALQGTIPMTIHEMKTTAGVLCECAFCQKQRAAGRGPVLPPLPAEENWADFDPELEPAIMADQELGEGYSSGGSGSPF
jgi:hypothetical protein